MKITNQLKGALLLFIITLCFVSGSQAQQWDRNRMKIELSVQDGKETVLSNLTTLSISFSKPSTTTAVDSAIQQTVDDYNPCYIVITFDRLDIPLLRLLMKKNTTLTGKIMVTDSYGKLPTRKIELNSIVMDGINDNFINDEETSYMNLSCKELIIDGVVLKK
ncbi:hypothetical protein [Sphingobacterium paucimobilis]|uniref:Lipid/polyisoprenoid-binding YceI-like domain-containing protein n=1 Tax=Sphingobacterium paucimobilis HER1398 TaxID=1346330 RepID=U2HQW1_9SPHI|nr:hypothetical protein [Sphingobacterium paucimobilis]ERJ57670.1 hypothetical protein M472_02705 [Sphingobacterium paucimobilis HER1398]